jgi:hypothetical protein
VSLRLESAEPAEQQGFLHRTVEGLYCFRDQTNFLRNNTVPAGEINVPATAKKKITNNLTSLAK